MASLRFSRAAGSIYHWARDHRVHHKHSEEDAKLIETLLERLQPSDWLPPAYVAPELFTWDLDLYDVSRGERGRFGGTGELDAVLINLEQIAGGSIQQEVAFSERDGRRVIETYRASFHIYFQEAFTFALNFTDWQAAERFDPT